uniref:Microphthalmia transcription factor n=1 Tax=Pteria penguin TaxID=113549 RepID=A0A858A0B4_PTEPN|nr:microphthalmia transcription factor [Pteria penguin]
MQDSGIEYDISSLTDADGILGEEKYYELKSKVINQSPKVEIKNASNPLRTNIRQQLMRQQMQDEEKKKMITSNRQYLSLPKTIKTETQAASTEIPTTVLKVKTCLENPTQFHVQQNQKRQISQFLTTDAKVHASSLPVHTTISAANLVTMSGSAPVDPDSPLSAGLSSAATSVSDINDMDNILSDILSLEHADPQVDPDLSLIEPTLNQMAATIPHSNLMNSVFEVQSPEQTSPSSSSCPANFNIKVPDFMTDEEARLWQKDRQKKDNHNMIERRRRFNINDRIKELGTMLPKSVDPDMRQNKGTILKASVDYIRRLKRDQDKLKQFETRQRSLETTNRKLLIKLQQMELVMKAHGLTTGLENEMDNLSVVSQPINMFQVQTQSQPQHQPQSEMNLMQHQQLVGLLGDGQIDISQIEEFMDDSSQMASDPMLSSAPVSPSQMSESNDLL